MHHFLTLWLHDLMVRWLFFSSRSFESWPVCCVVLQGRGCRESVFAGLKVISKRTVQCYTVLPKLRKDKSFWSCQIYGPSFQNEWFSNVRQFVLWICLAYCWISATQPRGLPQVPHFVVLWRRAPSNLLVQTSPRSILRPNWRCHLWDASLTPRSMFFLSKLSATFWMSWFHGFHSMLFLRISLMPVPGPQRIHASWHSLAWHSVIRKADVQ